jgi:hypothetical protein
MKKYAALFLILVVGPVHACDECDDFGCSNTRSHREADGFDAEMRTSQHRDEYAETVRRMQPIQVIEPDRAYLAYPSADGKTISVYGGIGRGFDRE